MLDYFDKLEGETIHILREVAAQFQRPVILYSVGKDSSVLIHLIRKAFYPGKIPFPLLHIDTGYKFPEMYRFRDEFAQGLGAELIIHQNTMAIAQGANPFDLGVSRCCGLLKTQALLDALNSRSFDAAIGGARRDEEKSRAKERIFSFRDKFGQWDPKMQRPELWSLYNGRVHTGESIRVFPLSNWTEKDIWQYIERENIEIVPLYFAQLRKVIVRGDLLIPITPQFPARSDEKVEEVLCRFRTLGCSPCTGAVRSSASTIREIIEEMDEVSVSERSTRVIDHDREGSMELKKKEGYF